MPLPRLACALSSSSRPMRKRAALALAPKTSSGAWPPQVIVSRFIRGATTRVLGTGERRIVVLFHDVRSETAQNLYRYLAAISAAAEASGHHTTFVLYKAATDKH